MFNIFGFYKFKKLNNLKKLKNRLENNLKDYEITGTIIISPEGVNGTISDKKNNLLKLIQFFILVNFQEFIKVF